MFTATVLGKVVYFDCTEPPDVQRAKVLKRICSKNGSNSAVLGITCLGSLMNLNGHCATNL